MINRHRLLSTASAVALLVGLMPAGAFAADPYTPPPAFDPYVPPASLPAVSAINGKIGAFAGSISGKSAFGAVGALSLPIAQQWGVQVDGMFGTAAGAGFYGVAGHLFWRDPSRGLLGGYASYVGWASASTIAVAVPSGGFADVAGAEVGKIGVEGEAYFDRMSLEGILAYQYGSFSGVAGKATVAYYPTDDLRLEVGARHLAGVGLIGAAGVEWSPASTRLSLFANAGVGSNNYWFAHGGLKLYFGGEQKSLIRRHREDDPVTDVEKDLFEYVGPGYCLAGFEIVSGVCQSLGDGIS